MDTIDGMRTFATVAAAGSFTAAAKKLGISTSLASKYVARLEDRLGVRLMNRTTRSLSLTEVGQAYFCPAASSFSTILKTWNPPCSTPRRPRAAP